MGMVEEVVATTGAGVDTVVEGTCRYHTHCRTVFWERGRC